MCILSYYASVLRNIQQRKTTCAIENETKTVNIHMPKKKHEEQQKSRETIIVCCHKYCVNTVLLPESHHTLTSSVEFRERYLWELLGKLGDVRHHLAALAAVRRHDYGAKMRATQG